MTKNFTELKIEELNKFRSREGLPILKLYDIKCSRCSRHIKSTYKRDICCDCKKRIKRLGG